MSKEDHCRNLRNALDTHYRVQSAAIQRGHEARNRVLALQRQLQDLELQKDAAESFLNLLGGAGQAGRMGRTVMEAVSGAVGVEKLSRIDRLIGQLSRQLYNAEQDIVKADWKSKEDWNSLKKQMQNDLGVVVELQT